MRCTTSLDLYKSSSAAVHQLDEPCLILDGMAHRMVCEMGFCRKDDG